MNTLHQHVCCHVWLWPTSAIAPNAGIHEPQRVLENLSEFDGSVHLPPGIKPPHSLSATDTSMYRVCAAELMGILY